MEITQKSNFTNSLAVGMVKSFLVWSFALTVCLLVVGFPLVVLMATVGVLSAVVLQPVLPVSGTLVVAGGIIGINVFAVIFGAAVLTLKGIHPHEVSWLRWLHGEASPLNQPVFAACPLTCNLGE